MRLLFYIFILCLTVWAGFFLYQNPGNIELSYQDWVIDMPLWLPVLGGIVGLLIITLVSSFFASIYRAYCKFKEWVTGSTIRSVMKNANQGWLAFAEGDWDRAEHCMLKAAKYSDFPLHYYLAAAQAAQEMGAIEKRDTYLHQAYTLSPDAKLAVGLTQARLQFAEGQYEYCYATLQSLQKTAPHNRLLLKLSSDVFVSTGQWTELVELLPLLKKYNALPADSFKELEIKAYNYTLRNEAKKSGKQGLIVYWDSLPKHVRYHLELIEQYAQLLMTVNAENDAEQIIRLTLKKQWDAKLVRLYGMVTSTDLNKQISAAESWLKNYPSDPILLLTLARLCIANKLWGKARNYLEASITIEPNPDTYAELGRLLGFLGEQQKSLECYKTGLMEFASVLSLEYGQR